MRIIIRLLTAIAAITILVSWGKPLTTRMSEYVDSVEKNCQEWTKKDWAHSQEKYSKLIEEYRQNYDSYTAEEKAEINKSIGKYHGLLIKYEIEGAGQKIKKFTERIPALLEGFVSAFEGVE